MSTFQSPRRGGQRGFTLIEALISLVVMAFGMLALSGMQLSLSRNADVAKQRTEAMRLAQARIEEMRSFTGISTGTINWNGLDSTANTTTVTNTTYTVASTMSGVNTDTMRPVNVQVSWSDRTGAAQSVNIASVISQTDPRDPGFIGNPLPLNKPLKRPKNRDINIPIPAIDLGNGTSSYQFSNTYAVVFSNINGSVVETCNPGKTVLVLADLGTCVTFTGYILAGYINTTVTTVPTGVNTSGLSLNSPHATQTINCQFGNATDQNNGATIANYKYYLCVIPLSGNLLWSGTFRLGGVPTTGSYVVCRFQYTQTAVTANERNSQPYLNVDTSMDEQNYLITTNNSNSASTLVGGNNSACPSSMTVAGVSTGVVHQDCRSANSARATECPVATTFP